MSQMTYRLGILRDSRRPLLDEQSLRVGWIEMDAGPALMGARTRAEWEALGAVWEDADGNWMDTRD